jgi:glycerol-3-phosphate dehydrogenase
MSDSPFDILIVGGGINGAGIARDAAGRGLSVLLVEQGDFAGATSSAATKLIHGGLRYLEYYEFRLVAEALAEREVLLRIAPHIIWPLEFVLPHEKHLRPAWMIRMGLFLYDHIGGRTTLPKSRGVDLLPHGYGAGLKPEFAKGFTYSDGWVDDARLVVFNARSAVAHGAQVLPRTKLMSAKREGGVWQAVIKDQATGSERIVSARILINAAGPWVKHLLDNELDIASPGKVRLVKGSHIVVPRIHARRHAFILQNPDGRVVFMIPYEREFTLIGTTDVAVGEEEIRPKISTEEIDYLCAAASRYAAKPITPQEVVWSYSGVRPLYDDGSDDPSAVTRDYHLLLDAGDGNTAPPLLSIFGGKITTYRKLAEHALEKIVKWTNAPRAWTGTEALPGGDFADNDFRALLEQFELEFPRLPGAWMRRLLRRHGTLARDIIGSAVDEESLGLRFGGGLYECEVNYLVANEWAREAEDILWRRTKCGLHMTQAERDAFTSWFASRQHAQPN